MCGVLLDKIRDQTYTVQGKYKGTFKNIRSRLEPMMLAQKRPSADALMSLELAHFSLLLFIATINVIWITIISYYSSTLEK